MIKVADLLATTCKFRKWDNRPELEQVAMLTALARKLLNKKLNLDSISEAVEQIEGEFENLKIGAE